MRTIDLCRSKGVRIGAHPGFPDREHMGRQSPSFEEFMDYLPALQMQLMRFRLECPDMAYIKPHGAWYSMLCSQNDNDITSISVGILENEAKVTGAALMLLPSCPYISRLQEHGVTIIKEGFADRGYAPDGTLISRSEPGAVLVESEDVRRQAVELARTVESLCLHGDTPGCVEFCQMVRSTLEDAGFEVGY